MINKKKRNRNIFSSSDINVYHKEQGKDGLKRRKTGHLDFGGWLILIPRYAGATETQVNIWLRQIKKNGGEAMKVTSDEIKDGISFNEINYIMIVERWIADPSLLLSYFHVQHINEIPEHIKFVNVKWLVDVLISKEMLSYQSYLIDRSYFHKKNVIFNEKKIEICDDEDEEINSFEYENDFSRKNFSINNQNNNELIDPKRNNKKDFHLEARVTRYDEAKQTRDQYIQSIVNKFSFFKGSTGCINHNPILTKKFKELHEIYGLIGEQWREFQFKRIKKIIQTWSCKLRYPVSAFNAFVKCRGIGKSTIKIVDEILWKMNCNVENTDPDRLIELKSEYGKKAEISRVWGIGPNKAKDLWKQGFTSIEQLRAGIRIDSNILTSRQKIGLRYYEALKQRIPRAEVERIESYVRNRLEELYPEAEMIVCGSYRRGELNSGDVDILIRGSEDWGENEHLLPDLLNDLRDRHFLIESLQESVGHNNRNSCDIWFGICKLIDEEGSIPRRVDIKVYPYHQYPFALLYFTGSAHFNRSLRYFCGQYLGYQLNDHGIVRRPGGALNRKAPRGLAPRNPEEYIFREEGDIFTFLNLNYLEPSERRLYGISHMVTKVDDTNYNDTQQEEEEEGKEKEKWELKKLSSPKILIPDSDDDDDADGRYESDTY